jgi:hypothetical protein
MPISFDIRVHIAVYTVAFFNFMFLSIPPRLLIERQAAKATGKPNPEVGAIVRNFLAGNWHRAALLVLLLWEASRCITTAISCAQVSRGDYLRGLATAQASILRLEITSLLACAFAILLISSAIGIWLSKKRA